MTELQELEEQKKKIEERIKELKYYYKRQNRAELRKDEYPARHDEWKVMYLVDRSDLIDETKDIQRLVATGSTKEKCLENLETVIDDLQKLYLKAVKE